MSSELIFSICSLSVMPGWLLLALLPRWKWTLAFICSGLIPFMLGLVYLFLFIPGLLQAPEGAGFGSLQELGVMFSSPSALLVGWIHYLAFDLFIGAWELQDAQRHDIPHWMLIPCFALTFMAGPVGLVLYLLIRSIRLRSVIIYS